MSSSRVDALLDAAEAEFADAGIETGSLRKIMRGPAPTPAQCTTTSVVGRLSPQLC